MKLKNNTGLVVASALFFAACDSTGPSLADSQLNEDVAMVAADAALEDLGQMDITLGGAFVASYEGAPPTSRSRIVTFFDAAGNQQTAYNPETTASMNIVVEMSGAVERGDWSASVERSRNMTVTGLEGQETSRTWNGFGEGAFSRSRHNDESGDRSYDMTSTWNVVDVVRALPRDENPYPISGTITRVIEVVIVNGPNGDETRSKTVIIEFNGTQFATMTVGGEVFELDLADRDHRRPFRRRK